MRTAISILAAISLVFAVACKKDSTDNSGAAAALAIIGNPTGAASCAALKTGAGTFAQVQADAKYSTCNGCHPGNAGYDMSTSALTATRVTANDVANSKLFTKIAAGGSMNQYSSASFQQAVVNWICSGAP